MTDARDEVIDAADEVTVDDEVEAVEVEPVNAHPASDDSAPEEVVRGYDILLGGAVVPRETQVAETPRHQTVPASPEDEVAVPDTRGSGDAAMTVPEVPDEAPRRPRRSGRPRVPSFEHMNDMDPSTVEEVPVAETSTPASHDSDVNREEPAESPTGDEAQLADRARRAAYTAPELLPRPSHPRVLTVANQKGGVGKTTTTVNVAAALAQAGLKVLVIDVDPQGNASTALGIDHHSEVPSVYDVIVEGTPLAEVIQECPDISGLWCAPATIDLAGAEIELVSLVARESRLHRAINAQLSSVPHEEQFDYIFIDCPPSLGLLTVNAFVAADEVFIPIQCEYYALEGLSQLLKNIEMIKLHLNPGLHVSTILLTMYDGRTNLSAQVADEVRAHFPDQVLRPLVPRSVRISEAPSHGETVMTYDPTSTGALSYRDSAKEIALRGTSAPEPSQRLGR